MRSRYCAYVLKDEDYLLSTWHASTRPRELALHSDTPFKWLGLKVVSAQAAPSANEAWVEFVTRYAVNGKAARLSERSRFVLESDRWFYVEGVEAQSKNSNS